MHIMLSVVRSPQWATDGGHTGMPTDTQAFANFMRQVATRYRGRVSAYEVWNEPNLAHESGGKPGDPAVYLATLQAAYPAIKQADPCALVLAAPMAATNNPDPTVASEDLPFYEQLYTLDDGAFLQVADAIAVHPGAGQHPPAAHWGIDNPHHSHYYFRHIERIHSLMQRYGDTRQVWITEVGWTVTEAEGAPLPVSEEQQAQYLVDMLWYVRQRYPWVAGVLLWNLNFSLVAPANDEKTTFSILRDDWSVRPAFIALQHNIPALRDLDQPPLLSADATHTYAWNFPGRGGMYSTPLQHPNGTLYAISPTGTLVWDYQAPGIISSAPARAPDGTLYVANSASMLVALLADGTEMWSIRLRSPVRGSPIVANSHLFTVNRIGEIQAFDTTGQEVWKRDVEMETTPLAVARDGTLLVGQANGHILNLTLDNQLLWRTPIGDELWANLTPTPDGGVVVATARGQVVMLDGTGQVRWRIELGIPVVAQPLVVTGDANWWGETGQQVVIAARDGSLIALDAASGERLWRFATGSDLRAAPAQSSDGMLYVGTEDERLLAITPAGEMRWYAHLRGAIRAPPFVAADGTLYVATTAGRLYAFQRGEQ
jgi:outer membrane protein assembly factor BamB